MNDTLKIIEDVRENARHLKSREKYSEADTISLLIDPVLPHIGFDRFQQSRESEINANRPDIVIWGHAAQANYAVPAAAIIEAKPLGADLNGNGKPKYDRPKEQIARYVTCYDRAGESTLGVLTDGNVWHIIKRVGDRRVEVVDEYRLLDGPAPDAARFLDKVEDIFKQSANQASPAGGKSKTAARMIADAVANDKSPNQILGLLTNSVESHSSIEGVISLKGKAKYAERDWEEYAYTTTGQIQSEQSSFDREALCVAVVKMAEAKTRDEITLHRDDVALIASLFAKIAPMKMSVILAIQPDVNGKPAKARIAVHHQGHTGMTTEFNPCAPPITAVNSLQRIYDSLKRKQPISATRLVDAVATKELRKEFYQAVATGWTLRQYRKAKGGERKRRLYREAVLRHLIRSLFTWILKEDGKLPQEIFDKEFARAHAPGSYHEDILTYMFHERLNKPISGRARHAVPEINAALSDTRFLNGSLFARHDGDENLHLTDEDYFGVDPETPGLFTILAQYDWTALEHTPSHSDQTIDPEVLSNLFENLIAVTEVNHTPDRMPKGTYYTPADVAREMCKDALTLAVKNHAPASWSEADLLRLFGDAYASLPDAPDREMDILRNRIEGLTVFDPAAGSGEFPLMSLYAIRTALESLGARDDGRMTRDIIGKQIFAQDINAMAVQITRLRLFIAIIAAEKGVPSHLPLPNLEARIVCADTLATIPQRGWSPTATGGFQTASLTRALAKRASIFSEWIDAHEETRKESLRKEDEDVRTTLRQAIKDTAARLEILEFAEHPLLEPNTPPAAIDPRLLFYREDWRGFDIVIGNPPYDRIAAGQDSNERNKAKDDLKRRGYQTVKSNDLYALIAEAGLSLVKPEAGVVTLIVPLSLCFAQSKKPLRELFERYSGELRLRNQDNAPSVFHESPVSNPANRQRTTILTAVTSTRSGAPDILVTGTNKWDKGERRQFLESRGYVTVPKRPKTLDTRLDFQWERLPTPKIAQLITAMRNCKTKVRNLGSGVKIGFPQTAYDFITVAPAGVLNRREFVLEVGDRDELAIAMAALNCHATHAWWKAYGDAFHLNPYEMATVAIPSEWVEVEETRERVIALGKRLINAVNPKNVKVVTSGVKSTKKDKLNLHECEPKTIAEIDKLYMDALNLSREPLLTQLRELRIGSTWRVGMR